MYFSVLFFLILLLAAYWYVFTDFDFRTLSHYLRIDPDLNVASSKRLASYLGFSAVWSSYFFSGLGFGSSSFQPFPVSPSNLLLVSLFLELGFLGFISCLAPSMGVIFLCIKKYIRDGCIGSAGTVVFCLAAVVYICTYQIFEFTLFRISAHNQVAFVLLGFLCAYLRREQ